MRIKAIKIYYDKTGSERMRSRVFNLDHMVELDYDEEENPLLVTASGYTITLEGEWSFYCNHDPIKWKDIVERFYEGK